MVDLTGGITHDRCKICRQPNRRRLIEADWADGMSADGIAKAMTDAGWPIEAVTIRKHLKEHAGPGAAVRMPPALKKRDATVFVRDRIMDELERREEAARIEAQKRKDMGEDVSAADIFNILEKDIQPAIGSMLKAQSEIDKRERDRGKQQVDLLKLMLGMTPDGIGPGPLSPPELTAGDDDQVIIEGADYAVLEDDDDDE